MSTENNIVALEARQLREIQLSKFGFLYTFNAVIPNNGTFPVQLSIEEDADFHILSFTGAAYGPCDSSGVKIINGSTDFPLAGTAVPSGAGNPAIADRGLTMQITDQGAGRQLTNGFIAVETLLTPGYGVARTVSQPFRYLVLRNSKLQFDIRNRDTTEGLYHYISMTFYGNKINTRG